MPNRLVLQEKDGTIYVLLYLGDEVLPELVGPAFLFENPLVPHELEDLRWYLEDYLEAPYAVYEQRGEAIAQQLSAWGERLFGAVFSAGRPSWEAYRRVRSEEPWELWVASASPAFLSLPWELLKDPDWDTPLALGMGGINRTLPTQMLATDSRPGKRLRILMVIARPYGREDVRYRMISRPLLERLEPVTGEVRLDVLRPPTFEALRIQLEEARDEGEPYQILHFDGHGGFDVCGPAPQGYLAFETAAGEADPVEADRIAPLLSQARVPLLVFNSCQSGRIEKGASPEAALATRLLLGGATAVVTMSYRLYAVAAAEFFSSFYEALFAGEPVSRAITEGRRQLHRANLRPSPKGLRSLEDWIIPVNYSRSEVAFPHLRAIPARPYDLSLEQALARIRRARTTLEGMHEEGDLAPVGGFFGRDAEIRELEKALRLRRVVILHGVGGTGKTELAKGFARWLRDSGGLDDSSFVFFHSFEPGVASFGLDGVVVSIGLRLFGSDFARLPKAERVRAVLEALRRYRILLVWDNFETVYSQPDPSTPPLDDAERQVVRKFLAEIAYDARGGVIITSRSPESWLGDVHRLEVKGLDFQDANELAETLLAHLPLARERRSDRAYADLLQILQGHPLSLRLILPQLGQVKDARELVDALRGERNRPPGFEVNEGRLESLSACVQYSFRHLPKEIQQCLPALSLFEGVADVDVLAMLSVIEGTPKRFQGISKEAWERVLATCAGLGLLTTIGAGIYGIHPALPVYLIELWRELGGGTYPEEQAAAKRASILAHAELGNWLLRQMQSGDAQTAMAILAAEQRTLGTAAADALQQGLFGEVQAILQPLEAFWNGRGYLEEANAWVGRCREVLEDEEGQPPELDTSAGALWLFIVNSQASRWWRAGLVSQAEDAWDALRQALEASSEPSIRRGLTAAYHNLGASAQARGDLLTAESWYRKSLEIEEAIENSSGMAISFHQLGVIAQARGDLSEAKAQYVRSLEIEESLGNRLGMSISFHQLGMLAEACGDLRGAESWYRKSLAISEALADRPGMARAYHHLGLVAQANEDVSAAELLYLKSLEIDEALGNRPGIAVSYHQLGVLAQDRGDWPAAEAWYRKSLEISEALGNRSAMAGSYHQLGTVAQANGDLPRADLWYRKSLEIKEALGDRLGMALTYAQRGLLAQEADDASNALDLTVRSVSLSLENPRLLAKSESKLKQLTAKLGTQALEESWQRQTGQPLPELIRSMIF